MLTLTETHDVCGIQTEITILNESGDMRIIQNGITREINRRAIDENEAYFTDVEGVLYEMRASAYYGSKTPLIELTRKSWCIRVV